MSYLDDLLAFEGSLNIEQGGTPVPPVVSRLNVVGASVNYNPATGKHQLDFSSLYPAMNGGNKALLSPDGVSATWGQITNQYVAASAAIEVNKLATGGTNQLLVGGLINSWAAMSDAIHGQRGGGNLHTVATESANGFMSSAMVSKLAGITAQAAALGTSAPAAVDRSAAVAGSSAFAAPIDHKHDVSVATAIGLSVGGSSSQGSGVYLALANHTHAQSTGTPVAIGTANSAGSSGLYVHSDHVHALTFDSVQAALGGATGSISVNSQRVTGAANPVNPQDLATKAYVDALKQGLDPKDSVIVVAIANVSSLSGTANTIDGVLCNTVGQRVLLTAQTTASQNGIWIVQPGAWTRAVDMAAGSTAAGSYTFVERGTDYHDSGWVCTADTGSDVVGTNALAWTQFSGAGQIIAGFGLLKSGNTLYVANSDGSITVSEDDIKVGVLQTDAQHGQRGGGTQHSAVTATAAGFAPASGSTSGAVLQYVTGSGVVWAWLHDVNIESLSWGKLTGYPTITATAPLRIDGGDSANLSTGRTFSIVAASASAAGSMSAAHYTKLEGLFSTQWTAKDFSTLQLAARKPATITQGQGVQLWWDSYASEVTVQTNFTPPSGTSGRIAKFTTNNGLVDSAKMFENAAGVSIGHINADTPLDIRGNSGNTALTLYDTNTTNARWILVAGTPSAGNGLFYLNNPTTGVIPFAATHTGNVGIGTTEPGATLDVNGTLRVRGGSPDTGKILQALGPLGTAAWTSDLTGITSLVFTAGATNPIVTQAARTGASSVPLTIEAGSTTDDTWYTWSGDLRLNAGTSGAGAKGRVLLGYKDNPGEYAQFGLGGATIKGSLAAQGSITTENPYGGKMDVTAAANFSVEEAIQWDRVTSTDAASVSFYVNTLRGQQLPRNAVYSAKFTAMAVNDQGFIGTATYVFTMYVATDGSVPVLNYYSQGQTDRTVVGFYTVQNGVRVALSYNGGTGSTVWTVKTTITKIA